MVKGNGLMPPWICRWLPDGIVLSGSHDVCPASIHSVTPPSDGPTDRSVAASVLVSVFMLIMMAESASGCPDTS